MKSSCFKQPRQYDTSTVRHTHSAPPPSPGCSPAHFTSQEWRPRRCSGVAVAPACSCCCRFSPFAPKYPKGGAPGTPCGWEVEQKRQIPSLSDGGGTWMRWRTRMGVKGAMTATAPRYAAALRQNTMTHVNLWWRNASPSTSSLTT